jgi:hypothetical protein
MSAESNPIITEDNPMAAELGDRVVDALNAETAQRTIRQGFMARAGLAKVETE